MAEKIEKAKEFFMRNWYHYAIATVVAWTIFLMVSGCGGLDKRYVLLNYESSQVFGDELKRYQEKDENLSETSKEIRKDGIESWQKANEKAYQYHILGVEDEQ